MLTPWPAMDVHRSIPTDPQRRITLSTSGVVPLIEQVGHDLGVNLAISLHAVTNELRDRLVPINKTYPLETLLDACRSDMASYRRLHTGGCLWWPAIVHLSGAVPRVWVRSRPQTLPGRVIHSQDHVRVRHAEGHQRQLGRGGAAEAPATRPAVAGEPHPGTVAPSATVSGRALGRSRHCIPVV